MNDALLNAVPGAAGAVVLLFLGAWENDRRTRRTEARKEAAADRAALEAQANEFVAAVLAVKVAGNAHDHLYGGWRARATLIMRVVAGVGAAYIGSPQRGLPAVMAASQAVHTATDQWDQDSAASAATLAAPLGRLGTAVTPLMRRQEPGLAAAADEVFTAISESYADEDRIPQALTAFHEALRPALEPPAPPQRWWSLRRRNGEGGPQAS
ncbi:hypothetical protein HEP86_07155 [Streptomyces sp. RPA4-5]|uniref:hypothetical protein n=1 Tax=Streptomyces sp. RPA4-5 TaxID=2721245 RepID=UPI00143E2E53|nr:hypothetical protein [Streptomyces sp. RPA4-5]QIY54319.1 hypothetical protein HEP86_07155 [Streptomyces sp. RPA4-5]